MNGFRSTFQKKVSCSLIQNLDVYKYPHIFCSFKSHNENDQSISKDSTNVEDGKELSTNISLNGPPAILEETNTNEIVMKETASNPVVPSPNTSTTITVKTKGKNFLPRVLV